MFDHMQELLDHTAADLLSGRTDAIAGRCAYPMVVHSPQQIVPFRTPADYAATLAQVSGRLRHREVTAITARLRAADAPSRGRFRAFVRLTFRFGNGTPPSETDLICFCRMVDSAIQVEMIELDCSLMPAAPTSRQPA
ncbi:MAG: hypothetical protein U1E06_12830 [Tabrizicola sp.]|uniref:hypothetical protein n=1 Tax=Tabrizicola sp. TaxID=2005166 RepID=UPI0027332F40|nr:hypothetical protein [Tabrizicola sp.]MDP3264824.1 hypothetical protein [Tabrizicola sp.]MDP3647559.1 hypothetical protein [Paracoccaceae bacterium]MDZ4067709.1 hypothetical protein [Tabrizicola sp.]